MMKVCSRFSRVGVFFRSSPGLAVMAEDMRTSGTKANPKNPHEPPESASRPGSAMNRTDPAAMSPLLSVLYRPAE